ncbi:MAG: hypothetical protein AAF825_13645 [Pseudomonadota bacterium]
MTRFALLAAVASLTAAPSFANEFRPAMEAFLSDEIRDWAQSEVLVAAIVAQNVETEGYDQATIDAMDQAWRAEVGTGNTPTIDAVLRNEAADFLRERVAASGGTITEVFIMDHHGLNVAASATTSDMWQGDEAKFTETFPEGAMAVHFSDVELDDSTQAYQAQISVTIADPATGEPIGAMTVGVNAEALL